MQVWNTFAMITSLSKLYSKFKRFILLVQMKKVISMNYDTSTSCWKPWRWVRFGLILTMRDVYMNSLTKFTSNSRSTEFKDILLWNISQMIAKTIPISIRIVISSVMKWGILWMFFSLIKGINRWISKGMSSIYLKVFIEKSWHSQTSIF